MEGLLTEFDTFKIRNRYFFLRSMLSQVKRDFTMRIQACDDAIQYSKRNLDIAGNFLAVFTLEKIECYMHIREYDLLSKLCKECEVLFYNHTSNWLKLKYYEIVGLLSTGQPIKALEVFRVVHKMLVKNGGGAKKYNDQWLILEGYIYLFLYTENKEIQPNTIQLPSLDAFMRKFLTQGLNSLSGDKEGANLGMMIIHVFLLLCLKSNPTDIVEKVMALDRYKRRYLNQTSNARTELFITILKHYSFTVADMQKTSTKMRELFIQLSPTSAGTNSSTEDFELIPFDIIWKRMMEFYGVEI